MLYYAGNDWLADTADVKHLISSLPDGVLKNQDLHFIPDWMHLDFIWGIDARREVYDSLIQDALHDSMERNSGVRI